MKERLEGAITALDKSVLVQHAERIKGQRMTISDRFSAGQ